MNQKQPDHRDLDEPSYVVKYTPKEERLTVDLDKIPRDPEGAKTKKEMIDKLTKEIYRNLDNFIIDCLYQLIPDFDLERVRFGKDISQIKNAGVIIKQKGNFTDNMTPLLPFYNSPFIIEVYKNDELKFSRNFSYNFGDKENESEKSI